jgi:hypothetical protein
MTRGGGVSLAKCTKRGLDRYTSPVLRDAEVLQSLIYDNNASNFKGPYTPSSADIYKVEKAEKGLVYQGKTSYCIPSLSIDFRLATMSSFLKEP